jgi:alginate O-acetyltransferase complex protein AlgJ
MLRASTNIAPAAAPLRRFADGLLVATFIAAIVLPGASMLLSPANDAPSFEKRRLAERPAFPRSRVDVLTFPARLEAWFNDRFGLRDALIRCHNLAKLHDLGVSPQTAQAVVEPGLPTSALASVSSQVIPGKQGWLFFAGDRMIDDYRGTRPFDGDELDAWVEAVSARDRWLRERDIHYLLVIAPNAQSVYPEFLPDTIRKIGHQSRLDQLLSALRDRTSIEILDLRPSQMEAKSRERCYQKTDTHWNDVGAFFGYRAIVGRLQESGLNLGEARSWDDFTVERKHTHGGDLATMLGLADWIEEEGIYLKPKVERIAKWPKASDGIPGSTAVSEMPGNDRPRAVMFHDSFALHLMPLLSEHFARVRYRWTYDFDPELVEAEQPDVVIEEFVERILPVRKPSMPPALRAAPSQDDSRVLAN